MQKARVPVAKEGIPFIGMSALATVVFALLQLKAITVALLFLTAFILYFFRDPARITPAGKDILLSPADGKVIEIEKCQEPHFTGKTSTRVSIFMSVFDCHVNRSPMHGMIKDIRYGVGKFFSANKSKAMFENEHCALLLEDEKGRKVVLVQVAGLIARRIVCLAEKGDCLKAGERFGMIRFGSRVDLYFLSPVDIQITKGDKVIAGQSIIGHLHG